MFGLHKFQPCLAQNECLHDSLRRMQCRQPSQKRPLNLVRMYITKARMLIILEINKANVNTKVDGRKQGAQAPVQIDTNARIWLLIIRNNVNWKAEILYLLRARNWRNLMPSPKFVVLGFSGRSIFIDSLKGVLNDKLRRLVKFVPVMCIEFIIW